MSGRMLSGGRTPGNRSPSPTQMEIDRLEAIEYNTNTSQKAGSPLWNRESLSPRFPSPQYRDDDDYFSDTNLQSSSKLQAPPYIPNGRFVIPKQGPITIDDVPSTNGYDPVNPGMDYKSGTFEKKEDKKEEKRDEFEVNKKVEKPAGLSTQTSSSSSVPDQGGPMKLHTFHPTETVASSENPTGKSLIPPVPTAQTASSQQQMLSYQESLVVQEMRSSYWSLQASQNSTKETIQRWEKEMAEMKATVNSMKEVFTTTLTDQKEMLKDMWTTTSRAREIIRGYNQQTLAKAEKEEDLKSWCETFKRDFMAQVSPMLTILKDPKSKNDNGKAKSSNQPFFFQSPADQSVSQLQQTEKEEEEAQHKVCIFCTDKDHTSIDCSNVHDGYTRRKIVKESNSCFTCLMEGVGITHGENCPEKDKLCDRCILTFYNDHHQRQHHPLLCVKPSDPNPRKPKLNKRTAQSSRHDTPSEKKQRQNKWNPSEEYSDEDDQKTRQIERPSDRKSYSKTASYNDRSSSHQKHNASQGFGNRGANRGGGNRGGRRGGFNKNFADNRH